jgi:hypothetical protein
LRYFCVFEPRKRFSFQSLNKSAIFAVFKSKAMSVTRLKRKNRKDKAKAARRRTALKIENFQPVMKGVDIEKIKEEFKAKAAAKKA